MENEVIDVGARRAIARLCKELNGHAAFLDTDSTAAHRAIESIRIDVGDADLAKHIEKRAKAERERESAAETERREKQNAKNQVDKLLAEMEFLKQQLADSEAKNAEIEELKKTVAALAAAAAQKKP